jgi:hypothetical protein
MDKHTPARLGALLALLLSAGGLAGCVTAGRGPLAPDSSPELCASARAGSQCVLSIEEGDTPVMSRCTKQLDGSLACDSPNLSSGGPRAYNDIEDGRR